VCRELVHTADLHRFKGTLLKEKGPLNPPSFYHYSLYTFMQRYPLIPTFLVLIALTLSGCTGAKISGSGSAPIIMNQPQGEVDVIERVTETKRKTFDFTGAVDISEVIGQKLAGSDADAIINTRIVIKSTPADFFINLFTLGIANSYTVEVTGELVNAPQGLSSLIETGTVLGRSASLSDLRIDSGVLELDAQDAALVRHNGEFLLVAPAN